MAARLEHAFAPCVESTPSFSGPLLYIESSESRQEFEQAGCPRDADVALQHFSQAEVYTISGTHQGIMLDTPGELVQQICAFFAL